MGPFPHNAPKSTITEANPAGTDGFEFVEFAHPDPQELRDLFSRMGYEMVGRHKDKPVELWQQGDITYILNALSNETSHRLRHRARYCAKTSANARPSGPLRKPALCRSGSIQTSVHPANTSGLEPSG